MYLTLYDRTSTMRWKVCGVVREGTGRCAAAPPAYNVPYTALMPALGSALWVRSRVGSRSSLSSHHTTCTYHVGLGQVGRQPNHERPNKREKQQITAQHNMARRTPRVTALPSLRFRGAATPLPGPSALPGHFYRSVQPKSRYPPPESPAPFRHDLSPSLIFLWPVLSTVIICEAPPGPAAHRRTWKSPWPTNTLRRLLLLSTPCPLAHSPVQPITPNDGNVKGACMLGWVGNRRYLTLRYRIPW